MEYEKIKEVMKDFGNSTLNFFELNLPDGTKISMAKDGKEMVKHDDLDKEVMPKNSVSKVLTDVKEESGNIVKSPIVGTFYAKSSPNAEPFVDVGSRVKKGDVLCIVEAMKLMNEIESEFDGVVKEILVNDGQAVEYGKPLFVIG